MASRFRIGDLTLDTGRRLLLCDSKPIPLGRLTYRLLLTLVEAAPNMVSHDELMDSVWGGRSVSPETISQRIKLLRDALADDPHNPRYLELVRGQGYRLLPRVEVLPDESPARHRPRWVVPLGVAISLAAAAAIVFGIMRARDRRGAREHFGRGTSLRGPEPGAGSAVPGGRHRGGDPLSAFQGHDAPRHCAHVVVLFPGQGRGCRAHCQSAWRNARSRRQRATRRRQDPGDRPPRRRVEWQSVVVGIVRPTGGGPAGAGNECGQVGCRGAQGESAESGRCSCQGSERRSVRPVPARSARASNAGIRRSRALPRTGDRDRPRVHPGVSQPRSRVPRGGCRRAGSHGREPSQAARDGRSWPASGAGRSRPARAQCARGTV